MMHVFLLLTYLVMIATSAINAFHGAWQTAIWVLFLLSVMQNTITQFKVLPK